MEGTVVVVLKKECREGTEVPVSKELCSWKYIESTEMLVMKELWKVLWVDVLKEGCIEGT